MPSRAAGAPLPERLPCGTVLDDIVEQVAAGRAQDRTEHQQDCTHCRAALTQVERLWGPVAALASERLDPPPDLLVKVMDLVHDLALEIWHVVLPGERGTTRIAARALARTARRAARRADGVRVVLGRSTAQKLVDLVEAATFGHRQPDSAVGVAGQHLVIDLAVVVTYGVRIPDVAADIRRRVLVALDHAGVPDADVNITVDDVFPRRRQDAQAP